MMSRKTMVSDGLLALLCVGWLCGCMPKEAHTGFGASALGGYWFEDSKDNNVSADEVSFNAETKEFRVINLRLENLASTVNVTLAEMQRANAEQWRAVAEHTRSLGTVVSGLMAMGLQAAGVQVTPELMQSLIPPAPAPVGEKPESPSIDATTEPPGQAHRPADLPPANKDDEDAPPAPGEAQP